MRTAEALIAWTPAKGVREHGRPHSRDTAGSVAVVAWPDDAGLSRDFALVAGACSQSWRCASEADLLAQLFILFNTMVLRDGIHPLTAHMNLLDLDEYRASVACELLGGATPPPADSVVDIAPYLEQLRRAPDRSGDAKPLI